MGLMKESVVYIDLDDTIVKNSAVSIALSKAYEEISFDANIDVNFVRQEAMRIHLEFVKSNDIRAFDWDFLVRLVSSKFGCRNVNINIEELVKKYLDRVVVLDDALNVLKRLGERYTLVLGTNGLFKYQRWVINKFGLEEFFSKIITPDRVGCIKTCEKFYSYPDEDRRKIVIGDHPVFDVYYPKRFGLGTILIDRGFKQSMRTYAEALGIDLSFIKPDFIIKHLNEVFQIV